MKQNITDRELIEYCNAVNDYIDVVFTCFIWQYDMTRPDNLRTKARSIETEKRLKSKLIKLSHDFLGRLK